MAVESKKGKGKQIVPSTRVRNPQTSAGKSSAPKSVPAQASAAKQTSRSKPEKSVKRPAGRPAGKPIKKKNDQIFSIFIHRILKQVHPDCNMSKSSMSIMNSFVNDMFERFTAEAAKLIMNSCKTKTLSIREIQTAVRLTLPGDLAKHAVIEGTKAVTKYMTSKKSQ